MTNSSDFDLIVLGSGGAGCAAALSGAAMGMSVCLIEKANVLGGGTADSLGTIWMPCNNLAKAAGFPDELDTALTYAQYVGGGQDIPANTETYVRQASHVLDELLSFGLRLRLALNLPDYFYPNGPGSCADGRRMIEPELISDTSLGRWAGSIRKSNHNVPGVSWSDSVKWGGFANRRNWPREELADRQAHKLLGCGEALIAQFVAQMVARNVDIRVGQRVSRLAREGGRVCGVVFADGTQLSARRGVVLATGGYEASLELVGQYEGIHEWLNPFGPLNEGDGLVIATEMGAAVHRIGVNNSMFIGASIPGLPGSFFSVGLRGLPMPGAIAVNSNGKRFCDETQFQDVVMAFQQYDRRARKFTNLPAFMIFDDRFRKRYPLMNAAPGDEVHPDIARADTLQQLAKMIGIDSDEFCRTVAAFNQGVSEGQDPAFGRGRSAFSKNNAGDKELGLNPQLAPLQEPPFYALPLKIGGVCSAGLLTDSSARVLDARHRPMAGLYACGNTAAPTFLGVGYQGGSSIGAGIVFGYLAARHALESAAA